MQYRFALNNHYCTQSTMLIFTAHQPNGGVLYHPASHSVTLKNFLSFDPALTNPRGSDQSRDTANPTFFETTIRLVFKNFKVIHYCVIMQFHLIISHVPIQI